MAADPDTRISLEGNQVPAVFAAEPWFLPDRARGAVEYKIDYRDTVDRGGLGDRSARYMYAAHEGWAAAGGPSVPKGPAVPHLTLTPSELERPYVEPYCVVASGVKDDMPVKLWGRDSFQEVVSATPDWNWKQVGLVHDGRLGHRQEAIDGAENLLHRTDIRALFRLIAHARCVLCHLSLPCLVAAAFRTPCVVVAGGRESPWLFDDLGVRVLHTVGALPCCQTRGCYASAAVPGRDPSEFPPGWLCRSPVDMGDYAVGACMRLIPPSAVLAALEAVRP